LFACLLASAESYSFHFAYADNGSLTMTLESQNMNELSSVTKKDIMKTTTELLRRLLLMTQTMKNLPGILVEIHNVENVYLTMRLYYYDDVTPRDYEPPNFKAKTDADGDFYVTSEPQLIKVGSLLTAHHG
jgi:meiosis-specific protein HOP1